MQKTSVGGDSFSRAMDMMKSLKSSALTDSQTTTLEKAYQDSKTRITLLTGFVTADKNAIKALIPATAMTDTAEEGFLQNIVASQ